MRRTTIALNSIVTAFFTVFVAYTFVARQHLESHARRFATEKTLLYSQSLVDVAEQSLDSPLVQKLLRDEHVAAIRHEIAEYRNDPSAYVSDLTREAERVRQKKEAAPLLEKVASVKERIRTYYDDTLAALIGDLRIFSASNLCAGAVARGPLARCDSAIGRLVLVLDVCRGPLLLFDVPRRPDVFQNPLSRAHGLVVSGIADRRAHRPVLGIRSSRSLAKPRVE